ncbi:MAG: hypothetical protein M3Q97_07110 [Bacteroidota bacterium]|nr:hypothetical protein [Bacteroidota bacterium]
MKILKVTLIAVLSTFTLNSYGQGIDGGTILMGGSMGFTSSSSSSRTTNNTDSIPEDIVNGNQFQFSLAPKMGYFFFRNFAAGMVINFSTASRTTKGQNGQADQTESESQLLAGPFFRYYVFPSDRIGFFGELEIGLGAGAVSSGPGQSSSVGQFSFGIGPGLTFFANDIVAIEALAKYNLLTNTSSFSDNGITFNNETKIGKIDFGVGFQFYFNRIIGGGPGL